MDKQRKALILATFVAALVVTAVAGAGTNLSLVAYSTPKAVLGKIIQAWQQTPDGSGVSFSQSYGPSTDQARAVANGLKADLVFLSTGDDVNLLVDAGVVDANWSHQSYNGIAADTVVVFAVRNGNPKRIKSWNDLIKPGVQVVTPEPVQLGLGEVEHPGRLRCAAAARQDRQAGDRLRAAALQARRLARHIGS